MSQEIHEILFKSNFADLKKAESEYKAFVSKSIADDKIRVDTTKTNNKILVEDNRLTNKIAFEDYKETRRKMLQAEREFRDQSKKLTGQSVELGSMAHISGIRSQLRTMAPGTESYTKLDSQLKNLVASYNAARGSNSLFNRGLLETGENIVTITAGLYLASAAFINFGKSTITAFAEQERSQLQLKAVTGDNIAQYDRLTKLSSDIQNKWGIPDEVTQSLFAYSLAQERSESQIQKNIEAARILSIVNKTDIDTSYKQIEATLEGNVRQLGRQEKDFKNLTEEQLKNGAAVDLIISKWGNLGNIEDSTIVKTQKLSAAWSETKETIGSVVVDVLNPLGDSLSNIGLKGQDVIKVLATTVTGFGTLTNALKLTDDISKNLLLTWQNTASQLPVLGGFYSSLSGYVMEYRDALYSALGLQQSLSGGAIFDNARNGTRGGIILKEPGAHGSNRFTSNGSGSNNMSQMKQEELNFLEQYRKNIEKLQAEIKTLNELEQQSNLKDYEKLALKDELLKKQKELNGLLRISSGLEATSITGAIRINPGLKNPLGLSALGGDSGSAVDANKKLLEALAMEEEYTKNMLNNFKNMGDSTINMLQTMGLIDDGFMKIFNQIRSIIGGAFDFGSSLFSLISGFIPGAGAVSSIATAAGGSVAGGLNPISTKSGGSRPIVIKGSLNKYAAFQIVSEGTPEYQASLAGAAL